MNKSSGGSISLIFCIIVFCFVFFRGCSEQSMTRSWGGEMDVFLEPNTKLMEVTWKEDNLWLLTKEMTEEDIAEDYKFQEKDALGMMEGCVNIHEVKLSEEELRIYEEQKQFELDYNNSGNFSYNEETSETNEVFIQYNVEENTYTLLKPYTYDEYGTLIEK